MKINSNEKTQKELCKIVLPLGEVEMITPTNGAPIFICKRNTGVCVSSRPKLKKVRAPPLRDYSMPMTMSAYKKMLNRKFREIIRLDLEIDKCRFITFSISDKKYNSYQLLSDRFKYAINSIKEKFKGMYVGRIRVFEVHESGFLHIHCVLVFNTDKIKLSGKDLFKIWKCGYVYFEKVYDLAGLADYLTNLKNPPIDKANPKITVFKKGAKIIDISPNLPKSISEISNSEDVRFLRVFHDNNSTVHIKAHSYYDHLNQKLHSRIDQLLFIENETKKEEN